MESTEPEGWLLPLLSERFGIESLDRDPSSIVAIAPDGRILWANRGWFDFACENGAESAAVGVGTNYFAAIRGEVRRGIEAAASACLASGDPLELDYECSSATVYRAYHLRMLPLSGKALLLVHVPIEVRPQERRSEPPDEARYRDGLGMIAQCTNCRRIRSPRDLSWHWVPAWVEAMPARITHVLCPVCRGFYWPTGDVKGTGPFEVLVVEDDEDMRDVLVALLRQQGLDTSACSTGEQALALVRDHHFDVIVTDQMMPGITGLELVHRARGIDADLRCVVLSGSPPPRDVDVAWLRKPISTDALFDTIARARPDSPSSRGPPRGAA